MKMTNHLLPKLTKEDAVEKRNEKQGKKANPADHIPHPPTMEVSIVVASVESGRQINPDSRGAEANAIKGTAAINTSVLYDKNDASMLPPVVPPPLPPVVPPPLMTAKRNHLLKR
jgi:hypothetical protein